MPEVGEKVFNIAAPHGITGPFMHLIFEGRYSGRKGKFFYYTVPARPGSSGSAVINENFELIVTINIAFTGLENVGIGNDLRAVKKFLDKVVK